MAYPAPRLSIVRDNLIRIFHPEPVEPSSFLTANLSATGTAVTVKNNAGFNQYDVLLFDVYGSDSAEIKKVNAAVTAGSAITSTAVTFSHGISTPIAKMLFNQIEISGAATTTGSKTVIATVDINVSCPSTDYIVSGTTYAYYFARFYNSLALVPYYGSYTDAVAAAGFDAKNVSFIRRLAFANTDQDYAGKFTDIGWTYDQIYLCELDVLKEKDHWSELAVDNYDIGNVTVGMPSVALPSDIHDRNTNKSILGLRIGTREGMEYVDRPDFERMMEGTAYSTTSATINISDTTVTLTDSRDFDDAGYINLAGTTYGYTTNTRATGVLSGFTAFSALIASGTDAWSNITFGEPRQFTVSDGTAYFDTPPSSDWTGRNIYIDYLRGASRPTSDGASVLFADYPQLYISWIEMAIKKRRATGELEPTDGTVVAYEREKAKLLLRDKNKVGIRLIPDVPISRRSRPYSWMR